MKKYPGKRAGMMRILLIAVGLSFLLSMCTNSLAMKAAEVPLSDLNAILEEADIDHVLVKQASNEINISFNEGYLWDEDKSFVIVSYSEGYEEALTEKLLATGHSVEVNAENPSAFGSLFAMFLPLLIIIGFFVWFMRRQQANAGGLGNMMQSKVKVFKQGDVPKERFSDVAGIDEVVEEVKEIQDFLQNPKKFQQIGAKIPKGVLLAGPPGTGKTLLGKAVAGESGASFIYKTGSDFIEMFVGVGAKRVRELFEEARKNAPAIIFIDEIDSIGKRRDGGFNGGNSEHEQTLNQLLAEMDGFENSKGIIVMGATNRPEVLDDALKRPGRFDRQVIVSMPDTDGRMKILEVHARDKVFTDDVDLWDVAKQTPSFSGADLENILNEAAILAARKGKDAIDAKDLQESFDRVVAGLQRKIKFTEKDKRTIAYHEGGHTIVGYALKYADPVHKVTVLPRGMSLGHTQSISDEDKYLYEKRELFDKIAVSLGGRVAEEVVFGEITTGASNDIQNATRLARGMVMKYGMSDELGDIEYGDTQQSAFLKGSSMESQNYSEETARKIDAEVRRIVDQAKEVARSIIIRHGESLDRMAVRLVEEETLDASGIREALHDVTENGYTWDELLTGDTEEK